MENLYIKLSNKKGLEWKQSTIRLDWVGRGSIGLQKTAMHQILIGGDLIGNDKNVNIELQRIWLERIEFGRFGIRCDWKEFVGLEMIRFERIA